jgi:RNA-binding protein NOB1
MYQPNGQTDESTILEPSLSAADSGESSEGIQEIIDELKNASLEGKPRESEDLADEFCFEDEPLEDHEDEELQPLDIEIYQDSTTPNPESEYPTSASDISEAPLYDDPSDEDDGDGEWITPTNVALHKSRALDLLPSADASRKGKGKPDEEIVAGCMTADFAMQNVLLQMGLSLVGVEGKKIQKVKTWVLRCHACFKYVL